MGELTRICEAVAPAFVGNIAVRRLGDGMPLVLVHGGVGSWTHWIANLPALARAFSVTAVDLPGYGDAPLPSSRTAEGYVDDVARDIDNAMAGSETFGLVGFSFGAVIAAGVARRLGARIRALSLLAPGGFGFPAGRKLDVVPVPRHDDDPAGHRRAVAHNLGVFMLSAVPSLDDPVVDIQRTNIAKARFDSRKISFGDSLIGDIGAERAPLQVIWGARDRLPVPSVEARADLVRATRPDAAIHIVPDAAHWVQYEAPQTVTRLLTQFHAGDGT